MPTAAGVSYVRRRSRVPRSVTIVLTILVLGLAWVGTAASTQVEPVVAPAPAAAAAPEAAPATDQAGDDVFAAVRGLAVHLPHADPIAVAFHEASRAEALALRPSGQLLANDNPSKFSEVADRPGPPYRVLSTRGREHPATSAVDIVVPRGAMVAAPVSGRVVEVRQYPLYRQVLDWRVVIEPDDAPDLDVVLIHLERPQVKPGQRVVAGETPLAEVRLLAFSSQIDYLTERHLPHTHIEVKPAVNPDAPAIARSEIVESG